MVNMIELLILIICLVIYKIVTLILDYIETRNIALILTRYNPTKEVDEYNYLEIYWEEAEHIRGLNLVSYDAFKREIETVFFLREHKPDLSLLQQAIDEIWVE